MARGLGFVSGLGFDRNRRREPEIELGPALIRSPSPAAANVLLAAFLLLVYSLTLHPGLGGGDSAELQWAGPMLGVCHTPGYAIQVSFGKLFSWLPFGENLAWRSNFMLAVFGTLGCVALSAAVQRISALVLPGVVAGATLGLCAVYWSHSVIAEVYVFYGSFLCMAIYALARFHDAEGGGWLYVAAICLGVAVADRPSELLLLPAFAALLVGNRRHLRLSIPRSTIACGLLCLPFLVSVSLDVIRSQPGRMAVRDDAERNAILGGPSGEFSLNYDSQASLTQRYASAFAYSLGFDWLRVREQKLGVTLEKYSWYLSGLGAAGSAFAPRGDRDVVLKGGVNGGPLVLLLAFAGSMRSLSRNSRWRRDPRRRGWIQLGWGMVLGNLAFLLYHYAWDSLTFTTPTSIGLCLLAGLGCSTLAGSQPVQRSDEGPAPEVAEAVVASGNRPSALYWACALVPLSLLLVNFRYADRNTPESHAHWQSQRQIAELDWPDDAVILTTFWPAMPFRYLLHLEAERSDVRVIHAVERNQEAVARYYVHARQPVFITADLAPRAKQMELLEHTPTTFSERKLLLLNPEALSESPSAATPTPTERP